jgi:Uncharacterised nucleotidyltransferase
VKLTFTEHILKKTWPTGLDLELLRANLLASDEDALRSWNSWFSQIDIENVDWQDHRMVAAFVSRLRKLDPDFPALQRLEGIAKSHWTSTQIIKQRTLPALDFLIEADIPVMFFKGIAYELSGYSKIPGRFSGDLDVMVPRHLISKAVALLIEKGWHFGGQGASTVFKKMSMKAGVNFSHANGGDFDLHHQPVHSGYLSHDALKAFWASATPHQFLGRNILLPSLANLLTVSAAHGMRNPPGTNKKRAGLWAIDFVNGLKHLHGDLPLLFQSAKNLNSQAALQSALLFTSQFTQLPIGRACPAPTLSNLIVFGLEAPSSNLVAEALRAIALFPIHKWRSTKRVEFGPP